MRISPFGRNGTTDLYPVSVPSPDKRCRLKRLDGVFFAGLVFMSDGSNDSKGGMSDAFGALGLARRTLR